MKNEEYEIDIDALQEQFEKGLEYDPIVTNEDLLASILAEYGLENLISVKSELTDWGRKIIATVNDESAITFTMQIEQAIKQQFARLDKEVKRVIIRGNEVIVLMNDPASKGAQESIEEHNEEAPSVQEGDSITVRREHHVGNKVEEFTGTVIDVSQDVHGYKIGVSFNDGEGDYRAWYHVNGALSGRWYDERIVLETDENINEDESFFFFVEPYGEGRGADVMDSRGAIHDHYDDPAEARQVAAELNAKYGKDTDGDSIDEARKARKTEHSGPKKGGAYYGRKKDAKSDSNKQRRADDKQAVDEDSDNRCPICMGSGDATEPDYIDPDDSDKCSHCNGTGSLKGVFDEDISRIRELAGIIEEGTFGVYRKSQQQQDSDDGHTSSRSALVKRGGEHVTFKSKKQANQWVTDNSKGENMFVRKVSKFVNETASGGATGAGAIAVGAVAVGDMQSRKPSIYGKSTKKPKLKDRTKESTEEDGLGRNKK